MRPTVRVLLAGVSDFNQAVLDSLETKTTEVVGCAEDADEAVRMIDDLGPDVVVADPTMIGDAPRFTGSAAVVFLSSSEGPAGLLETVFALISANPDAESEEPLN